MVGSPYQAALRLLAIAEEHWGAIDGEAASRGIDYLTLPFDRFLNAIYWWTVQRVKDPDRFEAELDAPLGTDSRHIVTEAEMDADAAAFMAFAGAMGVKAPTNGAPVLPSPAT